MVGRRGRNNYSRKKYNYKFQIYTPFNDGSAVAFELHDSYWSGSPTSWVSYYGGIAVSNGDKELTVQPLTRLRVLQIILKI